MSGLWFRARKPDVDKSYSLAEWRDAAAAFAFAVLSMAGLVLSPLLGHGSLASFAIGAGLCLAGILGFLRVLMRSGDGAD